MRNEMEYEANAFSAHLRIDDDELMELMKQGYDVVQLSSIMETNGELDADQAQRAESHGMAA